MLARLKARRAPSRADLGLLDWTVKHRPFLGPGKPLDMKKHAYLVDLYNEGTRRVVVYKAGQMGASEYLISYAMHACDQRGATVLYVFPTDTHVSDFSSARIGPAIEASEYLDSIVLEGGAAGTKRGADRVTLKRVRDRFIYFRGGKVTPQGKAPQLKAVDADILALDELDEMDPRAPAIARKRLGHSLIAEERVVSTPTYAGRGIHAEWMESDQREWHVRCEACGERQPLTLDQVVTEWDDLERPRAWHGMEEPPPQPSPNGRGSSDAWAACRKCGKRLDRLGPGEWVAAYPGRETVGYHLTKLFSPMVSLLEIVLALDTVDETERREAINQDLAEPYTARGGQLTDEVLDECRRDYGHGPALGEETVMGLDVGKVLHGVIRGPRHVETGEWPQRWAGETSWDDVGRLMRLYKVRRLVIDALPETTMARKLQEEFPPGVVWLAYYVNQKVGTKRADPMQWVGEQEIDGETVWNGVVNLDRTRTLDQVLARFYEGKNTLPGNGRDIPDYYDHLKALVRVVEAGPGGQQVARYVDSGPDHLTQAENYCAAAMEAPEQRMKSASSQGQVVKREAVEAMLG